MCVNIIACIYSWFFVCLVFFVQAKIFLDKYRNSTTPSSSILKTIVFLCEIVCVSSTPSQCKTAYLSYFTNAFSCILKCNCQHCIKWLKHFWITHSETLLFNHWSSLSTTQNSSKYLRRLQLHVDSSSSLASATIREIFIIKPFHRNPMQNAIGEEKMDHDISVCLKSEQGSLSSWL